MIHTERDKRIAEALGLCWHEWEWINNKGGLGNDLWQCQACKKYTDATENGTGLYNFCGSTFYGMGLILQKGPEREWWIDFQDYLIDKHLLTTEAVKNPKAKEKGQAVWLKIIIGIELKLLQDPDRLSTELYSFLKEKDGE